MTGGYQLLVPAALAVAIAFLTQVLLSTSLKHKSMYEAQVPQRAHSPAHHAEHLRVALEQLERRRVPLPETMRHVQLVALLESGVPVDLADARQLSLELVTVDSPFLGQPAVDHDGRLPLIMALIRKGGVIIPLITTKIELGDRLLLISSPAMTTPAPIETPPHQARMTY